MPGEQSAWESMTGKVRKVEMSLLFFLAAAIVFAPASQSARGHRVRVFGPGTRGIVRLGKRDQVSFRLRTKLCDESLVQKLVLNVRAWRRGLIEN